MSMVQIDWNPSARGLRWFGVSMIVGFGVIGALYQWGVGPVAVPRPEVAKLLWAAGGAVGLIGLTGTRLALPFYWAWMGLAFVLGNVMSRVLLAMVYYVVFTALGMAMRLGGRDRLALRKGNGASYWRELPPSPPVEEYERQF